MTAACLPPPEVRFAGDRLSIRFDRFDLGAYDLFLRCKKLPEFDLAVDDELHYEITAPARFAPLLGVETPKVRAQDLAVAGHLFDDQAAVLALALEAKRFACWADCGWGKTPLGLEWARQVVHRTTGRVLIVTMAEIVGEWLEQAARFYGGGLPLLRLKSREHMLAWMEFGDPSGAMIAVCNYEKWNPPSLEEQVVRQAKYLAGIVLDESSRLKTGGGKQKWALIKSCKGIEYKLSCTATPAPNEVMEFASQASFLEKMRSEGDILWTYFRRDPKTHRWTVKEHAREAFFRFMSSWSIYIRDPRRYGWRQGMAEVPAPTVHVHELPVSAEQRKLLAETLGRPDGELDLAGGPAEFNAIQGAKVSQLAKGFRYVTRGGKRSVEKVVSHKPAFVARLVEQEAAAGLTVLVWTVFDAEAELLSAQLQHRVPHETLTGKTPKKRRLEIIERFRSGQVRVLISRASVLGFGLNLQVVGSMIFSGWTYGYESYYQAVRRAYRQGQTRAVRVHLPVVPLLEGDMLDTIGRKQADHEAAIAEMERHYVLARKERVA